MSASHPAELVGVSCAGIGESFHRVVVCPFVVATRFSKEFTSGFPRVFTLIFSVIVVVNRVTY